MLLYMHQQSLPNLTILQKIWTDTQNGLQHSATDWEAFLQVLYGYGIGMEETLQYLHIQKPALHDFEQWIAMHTITIEENGAVSNQKVLTDEDLQFWENNGYVVLKNAIPIEDCIATQNAILDFLGTDINETSSWYKSHTAIEGLMVLFTKHATLEKNRTSSKIRIAYEQLYGTTALYRTVDKVSFNPPETAHYKFKGTALHWDVSLQLPIPYQLQGLLYLTNVQADGGAFQCVPGFHKRIEKWMQNLPPNVMPRTYAVETLVPTAVPANAGDFIIWHQALPHSATPNNSTTPRMVQYLTYLPKENNVHDHSWK
jgi:ectoine hydroxylase-related dioxygenase (phytanoyl-CoA dioxygenase family)